MDKYFEYIEYDKYIVIEFYVKRLELYDSSKILTQITRILKDLEYPDTIFDLRNVATLDSSGVGLFIAVHNELKKKESRLAIAYSNESILKVFEMTKMLTFLHIFPDLEKSAEFITDKNK